jgi:hypothetical protein
VRVKSYPNEAETNGVNEELEIEDKYEKHNHDKSKVGGIGSSESHLFEKRRLSNKRRWR